MPCVAATVKRSAAPNRLAVIDSIVQDAIRDGQTPGAVVLIGHNDKVIYRKAFGSRALEPRREAMTLDKGMGYRIPAGSQGRRDHHGSDAII